MERRTRSPAENGVVTMQWQMLIKALFAFFALLLLARLLGKKQISHLTFFD
ncbi:hypothetical protein [Alicyclobacillus sp. ALC3]|uniref:hypothetical protein n=1 Tax=Alicyclobacillus sp. ALC3 TaxID=2796143 RepID=UPI002377D29A|nr:hypothetical protein [Alicyclobacillus sp. ALC3]WDL96804.1 hypothetical protein JC200_21335 [Alicyclobacillus sp. ALC3]